MTYGILIVGPQGSGKTMLLEEILRENPTDFVLREATGIDELVSLQAKASEAGSYALAETQMDVSACDILKYKYVLAVIEPEGIGHDFRYVLDIIEPKQ